jgi:uncharacterized membrane protein YecN with MAPEG domain
MIDLTLPIAATAAFAGLNALISIWLSFNVGQNRKRAEVSIGHGDDEGLKLAMRAHANNIEYMPLGLILLLCLELMGANMVSICLLGTALTLGRGLHGYGMTIGGGKGFGRMWGTILTLLMLLVAAIYCLVVALF